MSVSVPASQWLLQVAFNLIMFLTGATLTMRGTSLPDLAEKYNSDIPTMGICLIASGCGGVVGCHSVGLVLERVKDHQHAVMAFFLMIEASVIGLMPFAQRVDLFYLDNFFYGVSMSFFWVTTNVICLQMWRHSQWGAAPFMHSLFLFYIIGFFIAPIICTPFLGQTEMVEKLTNHSSHIKSAHMTSTNSSVEILFLASSLLFFTMTLFVFAIGFCGRNGDVASDLKSGEDEHTMRHVDIRETEELRMPKSYKLKKMILVCLVANFYLLDYTMIMGISSFLIPGVAQSDLRLSNVDGALLISIFFLGQLIIAGMNSILSRWLNSNQTLTISLTLILTSTFMIRYAWNTSHALLRVSLFLLGLGSGSMLANTMVWLDQFLPVGAKITGFLQSFSSLGSLTSGVIFPPFVESFPLVLPYFLFAMFGCFVLIFGGGALLGMSTKRQREAAGHFEMTKINAHR